MRHLAWLVALASIGCTNGRETAETGETEDVATCAWDDDDASARANTLTAATPTEGYLCPPGDQDWYALEIPASDDLVVVDLSIPDTPVSPIQLTYTLWDGAGLEALAGPGSGDAATAEAGLSAVHQVAPGPHLLQVREVGNDAEDIRHPYHLSFTTAADLDGNEYNDDAGAATVPAGPVGAYISYRGDEDWYRIDVAGNSILRVSLTMEVAELEPSFRLLDGAEEQLLESSNPAGTREPTDLLVVTPLVDGGTYYVVVSDDDGADHDLDTPYTLELTVDADPDDNEPNDLPAQATVLPDRTCAAGWSAFAMETGFISSTGDLDWYQLPLTGCTDGVLEARATFDTSGGPLPAGLDGELRLVREVPGQACSVDQDCQALDLPCFEDLDCTYVGNTCLGTNACAGAGVCLPSGNCGAKVVSEVARAGDEANVLLTAPLRSEDTAWVAVADHQGNVWSTAHAYVLDVRVRQDPDTHEPNEVYTGGPPVDSNSGWHTPRAVEIPVHDCAPLPPAPDSADSGDPDPPEPDCCDSGTWVRGSLSYAYDQDWFSYQHPCPGNDCMVRIHFELDAGPTDHYLRVFQGNGLWFDTLAGTTDIGVQPAIAESYGGLDAADECFYAYQGHTGGSFRYHLAIRDTVYVDASNPTGGIWDASADQEYRVCIEKIANSCVEPPCQNYPNGCGVP